MFWKKRIYLDYAAGALPNPSSAHEEGREMKRKLEGARVEVARLTETKADDVIFTSGATEANAIAILGMVKPGAHLLYLPSAHASVVENMKIAESRGARIEPLPIKDGRVDIAAMEKLLRLETVLVSMDAVCGETGTIWNTRDVAATLERFAATPSARSAQAARPIPHLAKGVAAPLLHVDASQAVHTEKLARSHFGADLLTLDGGKLGARGAGCLVAHRTIPLQPLYGGGGQERGLRSGTENVEAITEFATRLSRVAAERDSFHVRAVQQRAELVEALRRIPSLFINAGAEVVPHILNISLPGRDTDYLVALLDAAGFAVSTRSACETDSAEGSRAVLALTGDPARSASTLRVSWGSLTSSRDLLRFAQALNRQIAFLDSSVLR